MTKTVIGLVAAMAIAAGATAVMFQTGPASAAGLLPYRDAARTANGAQIYAEACASCHGAQLEGQDNWRDRNADGRLPAPPHDPSGHTWHHPDAVLVQIVTLGTEAIVGGSYQSDMGGYSDTLSHDQILDVLAFIKSTWPSDVIDQHNQINARAGN